MITTLELLHQARFEFARRKMTKGRFQGNSNESVCAMGAIYCAIEAALPPEMQPYRTLKNQTDNAQEYLDQSIPAWRQWIQLHLHSSRLTIMGYNDRRFTTKRGVIRAFDRAIEACSRDYVSDYVPAIPAPNAPPILPSEQTNRVLQDA